MSEPDSNRNIDVEHIIVLDRERGLRGRRPPGRSRVIGRDHVRLGRRVQVIGGDADDFEGGTPPAIIIEKDGDRITRVLVKCSCGRQAELVCAYDDEVHGASETQTPS